VQLEPIERIDDVSEPSVATPPVAGHIVTLVVDVGVRMPNVVEVEVPASIAVLGQVNDEIEVGAANRSHVEELARMEVREIGSAAGSVDGCCV
jgi:hypothetical protein